MTVVGLLLGFATAAVGIHLAKRYGRAWHLLTATGLCLCLASLFLMLCTVLLAEGVRYQRPDGDALPSKETVVGDWHSWSSYSADYQVGDGKSVCFTWLNKEDGESGWAVIDSKDGPIGQLIVPSGWPESAFVQDNRSLQTEDYDGDGQDELGVPAESGAVLWYKWVGTEFQYLWTESGVSASREYRPYERNAIDGLTKNQQMLYREMEGKIPSREPFSYDAATYGYRTLDDVLMAWGALRADQPEIDNYFMIEDIVGEDGITSSLDSSYFCEWTEGRSTNELELAEGLAEFGRVCDEIVGGMPENASTYEKYRYLAQAVSARADYDYSMSLPAIGAPYGILTGSMICQGYAEAYQVLCQRAGLWCRVVSGESGGDAHAWNLVWLESGTYYVDITWSDEEGEPGSPGWMRYFMLTQDEILSDHIISDGTEATGSPLTRTTPISEEDAVALIQRAMDQRGETAQVIVLTGEDTIEGDHCRLYSAGEYSADGQKFTARYHYAVSDGGVVWYMDMLQGAEWKPFREGTAQKQNADDSESVLNST